VSSGRRRGMTINVAVKCPDGVVLGVDSLVTVSTGGAPISLVPYVTKLFPLGEYAAGAMVNGVGSIGGRDVQTIIADFADTHDAPEDDYSLRGLAESLRDYVKEEIRGRAAGQNPLLEIVVGGYSRGASARGRRYGELYSLKWQNSPGVVRSKYARDEEFGTHYGGQPQALDRFQYGLDDWTIAEMLHRRTALFNQAQDYIVEHLRSKGHNIPPSHRAPLPDSETFNVLSLLSNFSFGETTGATIRNVKQGAVQRFMTMERFFSLQVAVDFCAFLMSCAYAQNNFTYMIPGVGSEAQVASVTRDDGFQHLKSWTTQAPEVPIP
jgi:hypothetical protein